MGRARAGGVAALVSTAVGTAVAVVASRRLVPSGDTGPDGARPGEVDLLAVAVLLLGLAVALGGITVALVALTDRRLGRLEPAAPTERPSTVAPSGRASSPTTRPSPPATQDVPTGELDGDLGLADVDTPRTGYRRASPRAPGEGHGSTERPTSRVPPVVPRSPRHPLVGGVDEAPTVAAARVDGALGDPEDVGRRPA